MPSPWKFLLDTVKPFSGLETRLPMHGFSKTEPGCSDLTQSRGARNPGAVWMLTLSLAVGTAAEMPEAGQLALRSLGPETNWRLEGILGQRLALNIEHWLLPAPEANPGMLEMFRIRDRQPKPELVPWAGEFAGKYLISAVQAFELSRSAALRGRLDRFVKDLIACQAEDGYLGPFPKVERLLGQWDLWGHYHVMQGLLRWHELSGDEQAFRATVRAADLICEVYLNSARRVFDAGSHEMNMAVLHVLVQLHRLTRESRYLAMAREIEKDWERAGDYLRAGLARTEFYRSPRPRWESLHDLQGLVELWRVTGDGSYRGAFLHHWRSIARFDRHNTGGFSSGEQATGNPWNPAPIETCCTVAWMALSVDALRLTGDPRVADELELSLLNGGLGAQHPSGRWWTYNTPMDGVREASAHSIVFQARAGTPELNCCSVNGPRVIGGLADWAVMRDNTGLVLNWHGPSELSTTDSENTPVRLKCESRYPADGHVRWIIEPAETSAEFTLRFRVPGWSQETMARINGQPLRVAPEPAYLEVRRRWDRGDTVELEFDMSLRPVPGDREASGRVSLYRGPLLLASDPRYNAWDETNLPPLDLTRLKDARAIPPTSESAGGLSPEPWLLVDVPATNGRMIRLCDFATAGTTGRRYRSWLQVAAPPPPPPITRSPLDNATIGRGPTTLRWTTKPDASLHHYQVLIARDPDGRDVIAELGPVTEPKLILDDAAKNRLPVGEQLWWKVAAIGPNGMTASQWPLASFRFDPSTNHPSELEEILPGPDGVVVRARLQGTGQPEYGRLDRSPSCASTLGPDDNQDGAVRLNGRDQILVYTLPEDFGEDYSASVWFRVLAMPTGRIGQILSLWAGGMDDPLRLTVDKGNLFARLEAQRNFTTRGIPLVAGEWHHVAAVKERAQLTLYYDGRALETITVPAVVQTQARVAALGGNPNFGGNEFLEADFARFELFVRALNAQEIADRASR